MAKNKQQKSSNKKSTDMARKKKSRASTSTKNQGKRASTSGVPADRRQPKDRDPFLLDRTRIHKELTVPMTVSYLRKLCHKAADEVLQGNERFRLIQDAEAKQWTNECETFDAPFEHEAQQGSPTCSQVIHGLFVSTKHDNDKVFDMVLSAFDNVSESDVPGKRATRELVTRVASQIPTDFFKLEEQKENPRAPAKHFWDMKNPDEPRLNTSRNAVVFWTMASVMLNHPWRANFHHLRAHADRPHILDKISVPASPASHATPLEKQQSLFSSWMTPKRESKTASGSIRSSSSSMIEDNEMNADLPPPGQRIEESLSEEEDLDGERSVDSSFGQNFDGDDEEKKDEGDFTDSDDSEEEDQEHLLPFTTTKGTKDPNEGKVETVESDSDESDPSVNKKGKKKKDWKKGKREDLSGKDINLEQTFEEMSVDPDPKLSKKRRTTATPTRIVKEKSKSSVQFKAKGDGSSQATKDSNQEEERLLRDVHEDKEADDDDSDFEPSETGSEAGWQNFDASDFDNDSLRLGLDETDPKTYLAVANTPKRNEPVTNEEKVRAFQQVDMHGLSCKASFFETVFALSWSGAQTGTAIGKAWVKTVVDALAEILTHSDAGLRILPVSDLKHKIRRLHIRNEVELRARIKTFKDFSLILDMNFGNARSALSNTKAGEKQLRTRMKVGYDRDQQQDTIQRYLHEGLKETGIRGGCYPSPIQFSDQVRVGFLCFYPEAMNIRAMEKELMRFFKFKIPIGLKYEWVAMPFEFGKKWSDRQPGIRLWHIYVRKEDAAMVDRMLRQWLHPNTSKKDFPWAAVCHYVSDWKASEAGLVSVAACGVVKDNLLTMVSKARDFQNLTVVLYSEAEFPGMLKKAKTRHFGESTLLKILLSIKASPAQAEAAGGDDAENQNGSEADEAEDDDDDDDIQVSDDQADFVKVKSKKKRKSRLVQALEAAEQAAEDQLNGLTNAQIKAARDKELKLARDRENNIPSPLFLMVLPGEMLGTYILVSRVKYTALAKNVLSGIVPFLLHHLEEESDAKARKVMAKWISNSWIHRAKRKNLRWCPQTLQAKESNSSLSGLDDGLDFLDFGMDITDSFQGNLTIDLEMAEAKDIDDGATVAGALEDLLDSQKKLNDANRTIQIQGLALVASEQELAEKSSALAATKSILESTTSALDEKDRELAQTSSVLANRKQALAEAEARNRDLQHRMEIMLEFLSTEARTEAEKVRLSLLAKIQTLETDKIKWIQNQFECDQAETSAREGTLPSPTNTSTPRGAATGNNEATATSTLSLIASPPILRQGSPSSLEAAAVIHHHQQREQELVARVEALTADRDRLQHERQQEHLRQQQRQQQLQQLQLQQAVPEQQPTPMETDDPLPSTRTSGPGESNNTGSGPSSLVSNLETPTRPQFAPYPPPPTPTGGDNHNLIAPNVTPHGDNASRGADGATAGA